MTATLSSAAKAPAIPNKDAGEGGDRHCYAENGQIYLSSGGWFWNVTRNTAWGEWLWLQDSPFPSSQERARQIKAALDQVTQ